MLKTRILRQLLFALSKQGEKLAIVIITVVLLISMDRVSGRQTTNGRSLKTADDRFLNRFLHHRSQRRRATEALTTRLDRRTGCAPVHIYLIACLET
jgi:hypothetical protein